MSEKISKKIILGMLNTLSVGMGIFSLTKEGVEKITKELVRKGKLAEPEARKLAKAIAKRTEREKKLLEEKTKKTVKTVLKKIDVPTRREIQELKKRVDKLSKKIK